MILSCEKKLLVLLKYIFIIFSFEIVIFHLVQDVYSQKFEVSYKKSEVTLNAGQTQSCHPQHATLCKCYLL